MRGPVRRSDQKIRRIYQMRVALFLSSVFSAVVLLSTIYQSVQTLVRLDMIERERDQWQRPSDILQSLDPKNGSVVVDLGCGSGYFALKLSPMVGSKGHVLAVDIRRISLLFLRVRALLWHVHNIGIIQAQPDNPGRVEHWRGGP